MFGKIDMGVNIGKKAYIFRSRVPKVELETWIREQRGYPKSVQVSDLNRTYWNFVDKWWWDNDGLNASQVHALLVTQMQRQQGRIERAEAMVARGDVPHEMARGQIPDDVKQFVWVRDGGRCANCGATTELQFDHIVPVALGGATNAENLQILCGPCNRRKGAGLTVVGKPAPPQFVPKTSEPASSGKPAGWFPDPGRRHEVRYWNGTRWTEHVADAGSQGVDPIE
jgi:hypothetical protein